MSKFQLDNKCKNGALKPFAKNIKALIIKNEQISS
jgi:hypothetical protein